MSLEGKAAGKRLNGRINSVDTLILSAYAVAVKNGFEGTEEEWLASLKGEKGDKGDIGYVEGDPITAEMVHARPDTWMPTAAEVGARPNTWLPTIAQIGAAPAGYGLGTIEGKIISSLEQLDATVENGWYNLNISGVSIGGHSVSSGEVFVVSRSANHGYQELHNIGFQGLLRRFRVGGTWYDWEWVNPPMQLGVEYRTTERWAGQPVYTKLIDVGPLKNVGYTHANLEVPTSSIISFDVICHSGTVAFQQTIIDHDGTLMSRSYIENGYVYVQTFKDMSMYTALCKIKYCK